jgi:hypothetical protein
MPIGMLRGVTRKHLHDIAQQFQNWLKNRYEKWGGPVLDAPKGRRDDFVDPYFKQAKTEVVVILKAREPVRIPSGAASILRPTLLLPAPAGRPREFVASQTKTRFRSRTFPLGTSDDRLRTSNWPVSSAFFRSFHSQPAVLSLEAVSTRRPSGLKRKRKRPTSCATGDGIALRSQIPVQIFFHLCCCFEGHWI